MNNAKCLIENAIKRQEKMMLAHLGESEIYAINYCILTLKDLLNELEQSYEGEDGNLHKKDWTIQTC